MNKHWINKVNNPKCILFFNGWGMDENAVLHLNNDHFDICMFNNYNHIPNLSDSFTNYQSVFVIAWSMGVWMASEVLSNTKIAVQKSIAINGTPCPIHNQYGIPENVFYHTLNGWNEVSRTKFNRRMMGGEGNTAQYQQYLSAQTPDVQKNELQWLYSNIQNKPSRKFNWHTALVGNADLIFPTANQINWWVNKTNIKVIAQPHYPFADIKSWEQLISL
jgi:pimeloyl-[acyl-carrier protein] methyl ester esterase